MLLDQSWCLTYFWNQEENRKLSVDVGALHQDKKSLEKSVDVIDARNKELELIAQKLQVSRGILLFMQY